MLNSQSSTKKVAFIRSLFFDCNRGAHFYISCNYKYCRFVSFYLVYFCIDLFFVWWYNSGIVSVWRFVSLGGLALGVFATWRVAARRTAEEVWYGNKLL